MLGKVFKAYDIRATYPKPLNEKLAWQIGYATAQYLVEQAAEAGHDDPMMRHIVMGRDCRKSSLSLLEAFRTGVNDSGAHAIDVGLVDTPFVYFAINYLGCCGGVQTTASHNPANYNGFKISGIGARPVGMMNGLDDIRRYAAMTERDKISGRSGRLETRDLWEAYREHVHQFLSPELREGREKLRVVVDASSGMAGTMVPRVFGDVPGLDITPLNFDNESGEFAHEPNPLVPANLEQVRQAVLERKADFGVCFDGDADRFIMVDEEARIVPCDHLTAWLAGGFLARERGAPIVYDLRSTRAVPEMVSEAGGQPVRSRVGHVFLKQAMAENEAVFGGELSGHFYFRHNFYADSGAVAFAVVASALLREGRPLSARILPARRYVQSGEINFANDEKEAALVALVRAYPQANVDELDGVTLDLGTWWCNVRMSNTEPLLRLNLEGPDEKTVRQKVQEVSKYLGRRVDH